MAKRGIVKETKYAFCLNSPVGTQIGDFKLVVPFIL